MLREWRGGLAAVVVTVVTVVLVVLDLTDIGLRDWFQQRALTTDTVSGVLVLLVAVLVVDQVVRLRQVNDRARATAAQVAIVMRQAARTSDALSSAREGAGEREVASDELRTYMTMLLLAAPILIEAAVPRHFLEQAQHFAAVLGRGLATIDKSADGSTGGGAPSSTAGQDDALASLRAAATPLLQMLDRQPLTATDPS